MSSQNSPKAATLNSKERPQNRNLRLNPQNLGVEALPEGVIATKAMRFTLPEPLAKRLEAMSKAERDTLVREALELGLSEAGEAS